MQFIQGVYCALCSIVIREAIQSTYRVGSGVNYLHNVAKWRSGFEWALRAMRALWVTCDIGDMWHHSTGSCPDGVSLDFYHPGYVAISLIAESLPQS